ncbi:hypothetical protein MPNT_170054 [Candidatus Methylacidithermus pantelleriae]|uniref:Type I restriction enzyme HindI endonuclease subunit-like C-terminal domain-containing protein n=1 Tax=Candidatus Methylacidithermus pantelleriae TaxID=2744239 RepID=A0A8J2FRX7_9BACT|nr:hypothetical protein MPNT_170054 [Candidatus Methylacidithermus pantelleriae]
MMGNETLRGIVAQLVETIRRNVGIDWTERKNVWAYFRRLLKRVLRKYGCLPGKQERACRGYPRRRRCCPSDR